MRLARSLGFALALGIASAASMGCGTKEITRGQLVVALQTDMSLPKDVDAVRLEVIVNGGTWFASTYSVPSEQQIPATFTLLSGTTAGEVVDIRVLAKRNGVVRVLRETVTTVPTDRVATLRMPIAWLCDGQTNCPQGQTCVAGSCAINTANSAALPTFRGEDVFGGAPQPGPSGTCFDTVACFSTGYRVVPDANCSIDAPTGGKGVSLALVLPKGSDGICGTDACLVPLDQSDEGWSLDTTGRIMLPVSVCDRITAGKVSYLAATTSCLSKIPSIPTCGAWSSVSGTPATDDAGAPDAGGPVDSGPACNSFVGIDRSACDPVAGTGCPTSTACTVASATATACVATSKNPTHVQNWPCTVQSDCADGTYCTGGSSGVCAHYCCASSDCVAFGGGLSCNSVKAGGADAGAGGSFGACQ